MVTLSEFMSEILSDFKTYEKDIDKVSIKGRVIRCLRKLGNNIAFMNETIVKVSNSRAELPEDFKSIKLALKVNPKGCYINGDKKNITDSYIYKQRIENPAYFDDLTQEYITSCESKIITEKITINGTDAKFYYEPTWLSVVKGFDKTSFSSDCLNLHPSIRNSYAHEISITGRTLNTNFTDGEVYIQYYALPTDEEGEILIPEYTTGDIEDWIENHIKIYIVEYLIQNNLNPQGITNLYSKWVAQERELKKAALTESKFKGAGKNWQKKWKAINRQEIRKFEIPMLNYR